MKTEIVSLSYYSSQRTKVEELTIFGIDEENRRAIAINQGK